MSLENTLRQERDRYVSLAFCWAELLFELDRDLVITYAAGACRAYFYVDAEDLLGRRFSELIVPGDRPLVMQNLRRLLKMGRFLEDDIRIMDDRNLRRMSISAHCFDPVDGSIYVALRRSPHNPALIGQSRDEATGLLDGPSFAEIAASRMKALQAAGGQAAVTLLAMPELEALRTRLGGPNGDAFVRAVSELLKANSVGGDSAARVEDGRFSVLHAANYQVADLIGQVERLARSADPAGKGMQVEASTTVMDVTNITEEDLAKGLIHAIHRFSAKDANIRDMAANMGHMVQDAVRELAKLKQVIEKAEFQVVLHPIIDVTTGKIHHYEALCRFESDLASSPFNTILFAEETGLIHEFDLAMVVKVLEWLRRQPLDDESNVAVNVSGFSIGQPRYVAELMALLEANPWARGRLMFEITESSRMSDLKEANEFIQALRSRDFAVSLDDFGAGAASFQYLSVLEVDVVKLDGSAVRNAQKALKGRAFLSALTELCRRMGIETIAEMIDTPETLEFVRECGCNYVQGFLFGKPSKDIRDFKPLPQGHLFKRR